MPKVPKCEDKSHMRLCQTTTGSKHNKLNVGIQYKVGQ